jgi:hypothetical protein
MSNFYPNLKQPLTRNIAKRPLEKPQIKSPSGERARALYFLSKLKTTPTLKISSVHLEAGIKSTYVLYQKCGIPPKAPTGKR